MSLTALQATHRTDRDLARRIQAGDEPAFEALMRRYNTRLFRAARSILRDDAEAEDAVQEGYLQAYRSIGGFRGDSRLATWLTRIVINQALMRARKRRRERVVLPFAGGGAPSSSTEMDVADTRAEPAPTALLRAEFRRLLEQKIDALPAPFRTVFVLREVEDLSVEDTAACLSIPPSTVRTRLFRARALLREALARDVDETAHEVFGFAGSRCDRIVARTLSRIRAEAAAGGAGNAPD